MTFFCLRPFVNPGPGVRTSQKEQGFLLTQGLSPFSLSLHLAQCAYLSNPAITWPQTPLLCLGEDIIGYELIETLCSSNSKIQNGRHFWRDKNFLPLGWLLCRDTLWVKNFVENALSSMVFEI